MIVVFVHPFFNQACSKKKVLIGVVPTYEREPAQRVGRAYVMDPEH